MSLNTNLLKQFGSYKFELASWDKNYKKEEGRKKLGWVNMLCNSVELESLITFR